MRNHPVRLQREMRPMCILENDLRSRKRKFSFLIQLALITVISKSNLYESYVALQYQYLVMASVITLPLGAVCYK